LVVAEAAPGNAAVASIIITAAPIARETAALR
jgi:hypothetical protein